MATTQTSAHEGIIEQPVFSGMENLKAIFDPATHMISQPWETAKVVVREVPSAVVPGLAVKPEVVLTQAVPQTVSPVEETVAEAPVAEELTPVAEEAAPVAQEAAQLAEEVASVAEEVAPVSEEVAPVAEEVAPVAEEVAPVAEEAAQQFEPVNIWKLLNVLTHLHHLESRLLGMTTDLVQRHQVASGMPVFGMQQQPLEQVIHHVHHRAGNESGHQWFM